MSQDIQSRGENPIPCEAEKRKHEHIRYELPLVAHVLVPEDSFTPHEYSGYSIELCDEGVEICLEGFSEEFYRHLLRQKAYLRIQFPDYKELKEGSLMGQIFWLDYRGEAGADGAGPCRFGAFYGSNNRAFVNRVLDFVRDRPPEAKSPELDMRFETL